MLVGEEEKQLLTPLDGQILTGEQVLGEFSKLGSLQILNGTITTEPVRRLNFSNVSELRVDGEHEAYFPRERISFRNERPVKAISTESHPQFLVVKGKVQPVYHVRNMYVNLPSRTGDGILEQTVIYVLAPTDFRHWAEYISAEEQALLKRKEQLVGLANVQKVWSMSPDATLIFPDGTVDAQSGRQVVEYRGRMPQGRLEIDHTEDRQQLTLPNKITVKGTMYVAGEGRFLSGERISRRYGGFVAGILEYDKSRASVVGNATR